MIRLGLSIVAVIVAAFPLHAHASAKKPTAVRLSCDAYNKFEQRCHCGAPDNYFLGYGRKYCDRSLAETGWSREGSRWRDRTLLCLQKVLTEAIPKSSAQRCDCKAIKNFAFESHVRCYTQLPTSFCRLPLSDLLTAYRMIDANDLLSEEGTRQILAITQRCLWQ